MRIERRAFIWKWEVWSLYYEAQKSFQTPCRWRWLCVFISKFIGLYTAIQNKNVKYSSDTSALQTCSGMRSPWWFSAPVTRHHSPRICNNFSYMSRTFLFSTEFHGGKICTMRHRYYKSTSYVLINYAFESNVSKNNRTILMLNLKLLYF